MVFYVNKLQQALESPTFVVITDRNDLDDQLYSQFAKCSGFLRQTPKQATSMKNLKELLNDRKANGIFFSTMQKFDDYDESLTDREDVIVISDEAHRSQYGLEEKVDPKTGEIIHPEKVIVFLDKKLAKYKETMGFYSIVTSEIKEDDKEIINRYHGLSRIEDSFRIIKSDLEGRPIFVWLEEHIKAHFLICFIALTIIRIIQYKILKY